MSSWPVDVYLASALGGGGEVAGGMYAALTFSDSAFVLFLNHKYCSIKRKSFSVGMTLIINYYVNSFSSRGLRCANDSAIYRLTLTQWTPCHLASDQRHGVWWGSPSSRVLINNNDFFVRLLGIETYTQVLDRWLHLLLTDSQIS